MARFAAARLGGTSRARTSGVSEGWLDGSSRKYQNQTAVQARVTATRTRKAARQEETAIRPTTIRDVAALPTREKAWVTPWAKPQRPRGVQADMARVAVGKPKPSPIPSSSRARNSETKPVARPTRAVAKQTTKAQSPSAPRGPSLSPTAPPNG